MFDCVLSCTSLFLCVGMFSSRSAPSVTSAQRTSCFASFRTLRMCAVPCGAPSRESPPRTRGRSSAGARASATARPQGRGGTPPSRRAAFRGHLATHPGMPGTASPPYYMGAWYGYPVKVPRANQSVRHPASKVLELSPFPAGSSALQNCLRTRSPACAASRAPGQIPRS